MNWRRLRLFFFGRSYEIDYDLAYNFARGFTPESEDMYEQREELAAHISKVTGEWVYMRVVGRRFTFYVRCLSDSDYMAFKLTHG